MPRSAEAQINPSVLEWARRNAGIELAAAAKRAAVSQERVIEWETGASKPTIAQLRSLARLYRRPLALFFLPQPPRDFTSMHDFRRLPGQVAGSLSPELRFEIRKAVSRREIAVELRTGLSWEPRPLEITTTLTEDPDIVGARVRRSLGVSAAEQFGWRTGYESFNHWRAMVESLDVLVFHMTDVEPDETRAFSISEALLPVMCLNIKDPPQARCFSLAHEFAHLMLRMGGLCDIDDHTVRPPEDLQAERFCNQVAAATLMPVDLLAADPMVRSHRALSDWNESDIANGANRFGVSREAFVRRLLTLGRVTDRFYQSKRQQYAEEFASQQAARPSGFAPPDRVALSAAGPSFTRAVLESYHQDRITASALADYLDVRLKHLPAIERAMASGLGVD